jgi:hypothetical protein
MKKKSIKKNKKIGYVVITEQTHRFVISGVCYHLNFLVKCSIRILDQTKFHPKVIKEIYKDTLEYVDNYFSSNFPIDYRPTSKDEVMILKRELNKSLRDSINTYYADYYAQVNINSILLWDEGEYAFIKKIQK